LREFDVTCLESRNAICEALQVATEPRDQGAPALDDLLSRVCCVVVLFLFLFGRRGLPLGQELHDRRRRRVSFGCLRQYRFEGGLPPSARARRNQSLQNSLGIRCHGVYLSL